MVYGLPFSKKTRTYATAQGKKRMSKWSSCTVLSRKQPEEVIAIIKVSLSLSPSQPAQNKFCPLGDLIEAKKSVKWEINEMLTNISF